MDMRRLRTRALLRLRGADSSDTHVASCDTSKDALAMQKEGSRKIVKRWCRSVAFAYTVLESVYAVSAEREDARRMARGSSHCSIRTSIIMQQRALYQIQPLRHVLPSHYSLGGPHSQQAHFGTDDAEPTVYFFEPVRAACGTVINAR
jgi:hypothetical protein